MKEENVRGKFLLFLVFIIFTFIIDQISKLFALFIESPISLKIFSLRLVRNTGAAFGIFSENAAILGVVSIAVAIAIGLFVYYKKPTFVFPYALIVGGALGNGFDRLFRGAVIDFIDLGWWPVFNIADSAIIIGVSLLILSEFSDKKTTKPL
jgi:signal peptidase II